MFRTVESQLSRLAVTSELRAEFLQYDFERLRSFCMLVFGLSIALWFVFDLVVSFEGGQGFTIKSSPSTTGATAAPTRPEARARPVPVPPAPANP
ncbi:hypothetical protein ID144_19570 [Pseudomonas sp. JM0905a]|uniref:Uncharacterized protein n=1 Tax=Metapseudomonas resinovorans TaxID=53412 RepID=A0ABT4Y1I5_METRE|nr:MULTISPECIES: hypothetical protein [Pseudomonas]MBD2839240.1 hypothetical protein [Pseudomonas sp. JM0905a]MDA8482700.1 hypothetical protein [Pseudomonas resinovorans]